MAATTRESNRVCGRYQQITCVVFGLLTVGAGGDMNDISHAGDAGSQGAISTTPFLLEKFQGGILA